MCIYTKAKVVGNIRKKWSLISLRNGSVDSQKNAVNKGRHVVCGTCLGRPDGTGGQQGVVLKVGGGHLQSHD